MEKTSIGEKIVTLRKKKGCTQADLGAYLNISYQAVSKWERGESFPDFQTMSRIAQFFDVPITYFEDGYDAETATTTTKEPFEGVIRQDSLGFCKECGRIIREGEEWAKEPYLLCKTCHERQEQERLEEEERIRREEEEDRASRRAIAVSTRNRGYWIGGIVTAVLLALSLFGAVGSENVWADVGYSLLGSVLLFSFITQLVWGGAVRNVASWGGAVMGTPGVIFDLSLDGLLFLVAVKLGFAILRFLVFLCTTAFVLLLAFCMSPFTFLFAANRVHNECH